jgi:glycosyltransferase involved in cell wall biosynthesis
VKPRVLLVARTRYRLPLEPSLARKFDALAEEVDYRVLATGPGGDERFRLAPELPVLDGAAFYAALPVRIARELRSFRPHAVLAQGTHETAAALAARRLARSDARVILDVHGDWRAPTRLYGSPLRGLLSPLADRASDAALRGADGVRTVTAYTTQLVRDQGVEPTEEFPAFMDLDPFTAAPPEPLPERPLALFVGVLERYKNVDGLADAWRRAAPRIPEATLHLVGSGAEERLVRRLVADLPGQTRWTPELPPAGVVAALDQATALVLPSRSEGMGRVVVEAFCRGRPVVGSRVGGIPDLVEDGENGVLVSPGDTDALTEALVRILGDRALAERLGAGARASAAGWRTGPEEFARRLRELVERVAGLS